MPNKKKVSVLRSRLYVGMLPVIGILALICIYFIYNQNRQLNRLDELQSKHYNATGEIERLLSATSQIERILTLRNEGNTELLKWIYSNSKDVLESWLHDTGEATPDSDIYGEYKTSIAVREFIRESETVFVEQAPADHTELRRLAEALEIAALDSLALHNLRIAEINNAFRNQNQTQYYVVLVGIIVSVLAIGLIAYLLSRRILAPIDSLTQAATNLTDENWETDYQPTSTDEIATLENAFIEMSERIVQYKDYTSRKMVQIRRRMEACFDRLPHPVLFLDATHSIIYKNPAATRLTNSIGTIDAFPDILKKHIDGVFSTGEHMLPTDFDETIATKVENEEEHFLPIVIRIDSEEADFVECALILQNVTALRLSDELKSDLVATVSHELKTPVTSANLALHLVLDKSLGELNEEQEEMLTTARSDLDRLKRILDMLLQIARLENTDSLTREKTELPALYQRLIDAHTLPAEQKSMRITTRLESGLPSIFADPQVIEVALSNLLSNAIKYSPTDSAIELYAKKADGKIRLGVLDEGPGLDEDDSDKVFKKFYRSSQRRQTGGVGLGLSIVKEIALAHQGIAGYQKREVKGSDFWIELPLL